MAHDILIIDDEADIRMLMAGILEDEGYQTREASDSVGALDAVDASDELGRLQQTAEGRKELGSLSRPLC